MKNGKLGCFGILIIVLLIYFVFQLLKWAFFNILGVAGIILLILGIYFLVTKKKKGIGVYWPISAIIFGPLLSLSWLGYKNYISTLATFSVFLFIYVLITTIVYLLRRNKQWKSFSIISSVLLIISIILTIIAPESETTNTKVASSNTHTVVKKAETVKQTTPVKKEDSNKEEGNKETESSKSNTEPAKKAVVVTSKKSQKSSAVTNANTVPVTLTRTVDGDTIKVMYNGKEETVRYLLVDTPEEKKPGTCVQNYAVSAYNKNKQLVNSGKLSLEFETNGDKRDKYGRLLAYVFVNGKSVQEELLKDGYARVAYIYNPPYKYLSKYQSDEKIAENKHLNIWSLNGFVTDKGFNGCASKQTSSTTAKSSTSHSSTTTNHTSSSGNSNAFENNPADDKESNLSCKGKIKGNANSKIYHMPGDAYYDKTKDNIVWFCTESQAQAAGYRHSKR